MFKSSSNNLKQSGGEGSVNIQGETVNIGISYSDVKEIALDVFQNNFYKLAEEAAKIANERAEKIIDDLLQIIKSTNEKLLENVRDPDIQYGIFTVQRDYARSGNDDIASILIKTLVERMKVANDSLRKIAINEALKIIPRLTIKQINLLTISFVMRHVSANILSTNDLISFLDKNLGYCLVDNLHLERHDLLHFQCLGCTGGDILVSKSVGELFKNNYSGVFQKGFKIDEFHSIINNLPKPKQKQLEKELLIKSDKQDLFKINTLNNKMLYYEGSKLGLLQSGTGAEILENLKKFFLETTLTPQEIENKLFYEYSKFKYLKRIWNAYQLNQIELTPIGIVIAHSNLNINSKIDSDLSIWIK